MNAYQKLVDILSSLYQENCMTENEVTLYKDYPLSRLTSFRTGGNATVLFPETVHALTTVLPCMKREGIAYFILGCGSNVIAKDEGYDGIIVNVSHLKEASISGNNITAQCGVSVTALAALAQKNALSGMEFFYGIPGSVGGAVFMNAGAYDGECKNILRSVTFLSREGKVQTLPAAHLEMGYRHSIFQQNGAVILSAEFQLEPGDPAAIRSRMEELMAKRVEKQPLEWRRVIGMAIAIAGVILFKW